jgi:hypothetical protein
MVELRSDQETLCVQACRLPVNLASPGVPPRGLRGRRFFVVSGRLTGRLRPCIGLDHIGRQWTQRRVGAGVRRVGGIHGVEVVVCSYELGGTSLRPMRSEALRFRAMQIPVSCEPPDLGWLQIHGERSIVKRCVLREP